MPIVKKTFEEINRRHQTSFNVFDITDYTDAALIGSFEKREEEVEDEKGHIRRMMVDTPIPGQLEGAGLAIWDEFEYSGIFKQSQHKENAIVYLNTFMNTLHVHYTPTCEMCCIGVADTCFAQLALLPFHISPHFAPHQVRM